MGEAHWTHMTGSAPAEDISWGYTDNGSFGAPSGNRVFGFHSLNPVEAVAAMNAEGMSYSPISGQMGGVITAHLRRFTTGAGYGTAIFFIDSTNAASGRAYVLGLSQEYPYRIVLKKGLFSSGLSITGLDTLAYSDQLYDGNDWHCLKLAVTTRPQGDVVLVAKHKDPRRLYPVTWDAIPGIDPFIDDVLGANSGSVPYMGYRVGIAQINRGATGCVSVFDWISVGRQIVP